MAANSDFGQILATTLNAHMKTTADAIFNGNRALNALQKLGVKMELDGGAQIVEPIEYAKASANWIGEYDTFTTVATDIIDAANFPWRQVVGSAVVSRLEKAKNMGKNTVIRLVKAKVENVVKSLSDSLNTELN